MKTLKDTVHTRKEILSDLWPGDIGSHGKKEIGFSVFTTNNSQGVLKRLLHVVSSSLMSGWQNDTCDQLDLYSAHHPGPNNHATLDRDLL